MKLVAGSYERFLWGYDVKPQKQELLWKSAYLAHNGPVKCLATSGAVVATGGADDTIRVFDLNVQKDMGALYKHEGTVTCLDFHNAHSRVNHPTHLLSGSEDGSICTSNTDAWISFDHHESQERAQGAGPGFVHSYVRRVSGEGLAKGLLNMKN